MMSGVKAAKGSPRKTHKPRQRKRKKLVISIMLQTMLNSMLTVYVTKRSWALVAVTPNNLGSRPNSPKPRAAPATTSEAKRNDLSDTLLIRDTPNVKVRGAP